MLVEIKDLERFFNAVWSNTVGQRVVARQFASGEFKQIFCKDNADALQQIEQICKEKANCFFGVHLFDSENRKTENAFGSRAMYLDIDAKDYEGSLSDAESAIDKFIEDTGLPKPTRICSGNGYHLYWNFNQTLSESEWLTNAHQLEALCRQYGLKADESVTTDSARLLRVPGTLNYKDAANPKKCELITKIYTCDFEEIKQAMDNAASKIPNFKDSLAVNDLFTSGIETGFADNPQESQDIARLCLEHLSLERCNGYTSWVNVGLALYNVFDGDKEGLDNWDKFSKQGSEYKAGECTEKWQTFGGREGGLTVASLIRWACEDSTEFCEIWEKRKEEKRLEHLAAKSHGIQLTDYGNAQRLVALHGENTRFDYERKVWFVWNGKFWQENAEAKVWQFAKVTAKAMYKEASQISDDSRRQTLAKHAIKSESANSLRAMVKLAETEPEIQVEVSEFDAHPHLLNVANGIIDLRNGALLPHTRDRMLTNYVPIEYNPNAACPIYDKFLSRIFAGNRNLISYIDRAIGYTLTGETGEQCLFTCYGKGANGKSTLLNVIENLLGDAATSVRTEALMSHKFTANSGHNEDVANLRGKRFVSAVETESGHQLAESLIKQLTGGDTVKASRKHEHQIQFKARFKLWLAANHKPQIKGTDEGIWRRIHLIPFEETIPENERDKDLDKKLQSELQGILARTVCGAITWYAQGLGKVPEIENATSAYRNEQDTVAIFLAENAEKSAGFGVFPSILYDCYKQWCIDSGDAKLNNREFPANLERLGFKKTSIKYAGISRQIWRGIKMKSESDFVVNPNVALN